MADRITQLQDLVMQQAENILMSISLIEKHAKPYIFPDIEKRTPKLSKKEKYKLEMEKKINEDKFLKEETKNTNENIDENSIDYPLYYAKKIAEVAIDINTLIDSLPDDSILSPELQVESLERLERENINLAKELEVVVLKSESLLEKIRLSLASISSEYLKTFFPE